MFWVLPLFMFTERKRKVKNALVALIVRLTASAAVLAAIISDENPAEFRLCRVLLFNEVFDFVKSFFGNGSALLIYPLHNIGVVLNSAYFKSGLRANNKHIA